MWVMCDPYVLWLWLLLWVVFVFAKSDFCHKLWCSGEDYKHLLELILDTDIYHFTQENKVSVLRLFLVLWLHAEDQWMRECSAVLLQDNVKEKVLYTGVHSNLGHCCCFCNVITMLCYYSHKKRIYWSKSTLQGACPCLPPTTALWYVVFPRLSPLPPFYNVV